MSDSPALDSGAGRALAAQGLRVGYQPGVPVLDGIDVAVRPGHTLGMTGPSGGGKSTLVRVLGLLLEPWNGTVTVDGEPIHAFRYRAPRELRRAIGVVFQSPRRAADPRHTLGEIVATPTRMAGWSPADARRRLADLTDLVGLTDDLLERRPHEVSDGQLQRACLARALCLRPRYLLCDEMTAMLDASTTAALVGVVRQLVAETGLGVLAVSHDEELLRVWADSVTPLSGHP